MQGIQGYQGHQGIQGDLGIQGDFGQQGTQGTQGQQGIQGDLGVQGEGFIWLGTWSGGNSYLKNSVVYYQGRSYIAIVAPTPGYENPPSVNTSHWSILADIGSQGIQGTDGIQGVQGVQGVQGQVGSQGFGLTWKGTWSSSTVYNYNDVITYNGSSYISLISNNTGNQPDLNTVLWNLINSQGLQGLQGQQGIQGFGYQQLQGTQGLQGIAGQFSAQGIQGPQGPGYIGADGAQGTQGIQGPGGTIATVIFDGGAPSTSYTNGPAFDCGGVN